MGTLGSCGCCDCAGGTQFSWDEWYDTSGGGMPDCGAWVYSTQAFTNPYDVPATVTIDGPVDDALQLQNADGSYSLIGEGGQCDGGDGPAACNCGFTGYTMTVDAGESITLQLVDMIAAYCWCDVVICFTPTE